MLALLWLALLLVCGIWLRRRLLPDGGRFLSAATDPASGAAFPAVFFNLPAALLLGIIPLTTLLYFLAVLCRSLGFQVRGSSLLAANLLFCLLLLICALPLLLLARKRRRDTEAGVSPLHPGLTGTSGQRFRQFFCRGVSRQDRRNAAGRDVVGPSFVQRLRLAWPWLAALALMAFFCYSFNYYVFGMRGTFIESGASVTSDYAAHLATISSFVRGENFAPSTYPFFAGDGLRYHFFFFFFSANLHALGLSLPAALNLASSIGLCCFSCLMGLLAVRFTGRRSAFFWIQPLLYLQSSFSGFFFLRDILARAQAEGRSFLALIAENKSFIGRLPNDNWGLWCVNVYANQRHLLFGLAAALLVLICILPSLEERSDLSGKKLPLSRPVRALWFSADAWLSGTEAELKAFGAAALILACLPYWHGAVTVALLLMLALCALPARNKLLFLFLGLLTVASALAFGRYFSGGAADVAVPRWQWGFISADQSLKGVLLYILELLGLAFPALIILPWFMSGRLRRTLSFSFLLPLIFAFTISLTPDITVNHKYIIFARLFVCLPLLVLLMALWRPRGEITTGRLLLSRSLALLLGLLLTFSGFLDQLAYGQTNRYPFAMNTNTAFGRWLEEETDPRAVFLTPTWFFHPFYYSGRQTWFGYPYYAWSAGHDTYRRDAEAKTLWAGGKSQQAFYDLVAQYQLRYALIDDELRRVEAGNLDEAFFAQHFPLVAEYPELGNLRVYELR